MIVGATLTSVTPVAISSKTTSRELSVRTVSVTSSIRKSPSFNSESLTRNRWPAANPSARNVAEEEVIV